jgi:tRNA threonylcarbamoyladenosine biosynthesis protein TsaE
VIEILKKITHSPEETFSLGAEFSKQITPGTILCFKGDLGAGKTVCIKGICHGLGVSEHVTIPTFTLINVYYWLLPVYHFDFYRIQSEYELTDLGVEEYFYGRGVCLIEWPEVIQSLLPKQHYEFRLKWEPSFGAEERRIAVYSQGSDRVHPGT